jgi:hypothetical protein
MISLEISSLDGRMLIAYTKYSLIIPTFYQDKNSQTTTYDVIKTGGDFT